MSVEKKEPEIRFKRFSGEWKQHNLGELIDIRSAARVHKEQWTETGVPFFRTSDVVSIYKGQENAKAFISYDVYKELTGKIGKVSSGDLLVTGGGSIGIPFLVPNDNPLYFKDADLLWFKNDQKFDGYFLYTFLFSETFKKYIKSISHIGTIAHYTIEQAKSTPINNCERAEQTAIGNTFQKLDNLINQHQQKHDKLSNIKTAMLERMFPKQGETVPEIRFKGFSGEWEEKPFGTCFANVPNNTLSRAELNYRTGLAKNIHYGDVLIKFGETLDADSELIPFITNNDVANKLKHTALQSGDIVIADAAEDNTVGKCVELINVGDLLVFSGLHTIAVRPTLPFGSKYLGYYLNSASYHDQLSSLMQGTKVLSISKTAIQNTLVVFPNNVEEQAAIGNYFQKLDALINQHQQQITKLNNIKQACLSKMFV
ncbi:restriction endonuclease subunit S [Vibrio fluvialis]|uniref:Type I restriction enzyme, S subunit n=1 Tax=Vibrio cincinnatiensis DSM 19608 TaxID=1123491 RepID=A0A1T4S4W7_VIBCI|nr:restriction endonuclease subunit S [Vibrio cincinnatiensis]EKO3450046.1 restriction endonuclease subunit S [Vibrio fluvialis]HDY8078980.1 restriction endonuclease subunit S [Vibrio vulnificus]EKO3462048.1 restriction endonuclease subunit S [Vibrio fluvialis]ELV8681808.1 restriction endonuclease subunit S [Vibrio fluvialis]SKA22851.1 type I restriction enzyme, S subunit [Vibrio cincinnatiensis DSM 19608]